MSKLSIDANDLRDLLKARYELLLLECNGIDNWSGYDLSGEESGMESLSDYSDNLDEADDEDLLSYL